MADLKVQFHTSQWHNLPEEAKVLIGQLCGPLMPDARGVLTMVLSETHWAEIQRTITNETTQGR